MLMKVRSRFPSAVPPPVSPVRPALREVRPPVDLDETLPLGTTARLRSAPEILPMKCLRCQGPVQRGTAPVRVDRDGYKLSWEAVPAWVCTRCEHAYFEPQEVETVRKALRAMRKLAMEATETM
ncbi:MAG TPA: YgiT-type zinc finger protein [Thermoanaerobaculia bacterium]|nr:YgiT-type zinc finger protein [Thermoanaerobaculia bacterium]